MQRTHRPVLIFPGGSPRLSRTQYVCLWVRRRTSQVWGETGRLWTGQRTGWEWDLQSWERGEVGEMDGVRIWVRKRERERERERGREGDRERERERERERKRERGREGGMEGEREEGGGYSKLKERKWVGENERSWEGRNLGRVIEGTQGERDWWKRERSTVGGDGNRNV